jgi:hypothetical protein
VESATDLKFIYCINNLFSESRDGIKSGVGAAAKKLGRSAAMMYEK